MFRRGLIYSVQEGLLTIWRNKLISLLSIGTIAISFAVLGLFMLVAVNVGALAESYGDTLMIHAFLIDDLDAKQTGNLKDILEKDERIQSVHHVDKDAAAERFADLFPDEEEILNSLEENYLPASFEIYLENELSFDNEGIQALIKHLESMPAVETVLYDRQWVETLESTGRWIAYAGFVLGGMLILAAIVTTSNIIKMNVLNRQDEIEIMRLVGADGIFVRGPFLFGGIIQGLLSSIIAMVLVYLIYYFGGFFLESANIELLRDLQIRFLPLQILGAFILGGLVVGTLASLLSFGKMSRI